MIVILDLAVTIIIRFLNTLNATAGYDMLADPRSLEAWLVSTHPAGTGGPVSLPDVEWAIEFREAIRGFAAGNSGVPPTAAAAEIVNRAARIAGLRLDFGQGGSVRVTSSSTGVAGVIATVLSAMHRAMSDGSWGRLKICRNPDCRWAFYDRSRNHSRIWCEMKECGNVMKARRFRRKAREARSAGGTRSGEQ